MLPDASEWQMLLHARLVENASVTMASVAGNIVNAVIAGVLLAAYDLLALRWALPTIAFLAVIIWWRAALARQIAASEAGDLRISGWHRKLTAAGALLGALWGAVTYVILASGVVEIQLIGGILGAGMMSAGAIAFRTLPRAALAYVTSCACGGALGLIAIGMTPAYAGLALLICYFAVLRTNIIATSQRFDNAFWRANDLAETTETVHLLLNDLTEQGSDWIVEVDKLCQIVDPSPKFAEAAGMDASQMEGMPLGDLLDKGPERDLLKQLFLAGEKIQRHAISLTIDDQKRWWSISARPSRCGKVRYRGVVTDITAQRTAEERVHFLAHYDELTALPNRILFNDSVERALSRGENGIALMYLDLDRFKYVNDTFGHPAGDEILKQAAARLTATLGRYDLAARIGGDEFAILLTGARVEQAEQVAAKIVRDFRSPMRLGDSDLVIGCSIGFAVSPEDGTSLDGLMRRADLALYAAKAQGRQQAARFELKLDHQAKARREIEFDLRKALANDELELLYQPQINVMTGDVTGFEALIRWQHPQRGLVMPDSFIPIAEETGVIVPIGEWVIRRALSEAASWPDHISISINLSPTQMRSAGLIGTLMQAAAHSGVRPSRICLEITETVLMQDTESNLATLRNIRQLGMQVSLDDFGTGYSSLSYLRSFPFDKLKIDRSFVSDIDSNEDCLAIIRSVVSLAKSLGMATVAEGVERVQQAAILEREGCSELQGYLYSMPVASDEIAGFFATHQRLRATG